MQYYKDYYMMYLTADAKVRADSKKHWVECHKKNLESGREDLIIFSAKILGSIVMAENELEQYEYISVDNFMNQLAQI